MFKKVSLFIGSAFMLLFIAGCVTATGSYTADTNFSASLTGLMKQRSAAYEGVYRNPVVIIHGFIGADLVDKKSGDIIWNADIIKNNSSLSDVKMRALSIPMKKSKPLSEIIDEAIPESAFNPTGKSWADIQSSSNPYAALLYLLHNGGYQLENTTLDPGKRFYNLFQFSYDWRRDLQESAVKLHEYLMKKKKYLQEQYLKCYGIKDYDVQFDLIAYGTGGLISRYYLRFGTADLPKTDEKLQITWAGSKNVYRLIMLGTPNAGCLDSVIEMQKGVSMPNLPSALLSTWPSYYQVMPAPSTKSVVYGSNYSKSVDLYDIKTWNMIKWGLLDPHQDKVLKILLPDAADQKERRTIATDHLQKCLQRAKRFQEVMKVPATPPDDVKLYIFSGNAVKTTRKISVNMTTGEFNVIEFDVGDGKVLETSTVFDKRAGKKWWVPVLISPISWSGIYHVRSAHMGITENPFFQDNIFDLLRHPQMKK